MGYTFSIYNEKGTLVREFRNKDERPENESFKNIFDRMFSAKTGTTVPETFRWDGVMESGELAPDGTYGFKMAFWDDNDNRSETELMTVVIDTVPPEVEVEQLQGLDLIFSPDGDGNKDTLTIRQTGSLEELWAAASRRRQAVRSAATMLRTAPLKRLSGMEKTTTGRLLPMAFTAILLNPLTEPVTTALQALKIFLSIPNSPPSA